jgi:hypothetical protein
VLFGCLLISFGIGAPTGMGVRSGHTLRARTCLHLLRLIGGCSPCQHGALCCLREATEVVRQLAPRSPTHRLPLAAGIFVAMLAIGGGWGRLVGPQVSLPAYTIVGAAAMLGEWVVAHNHARTRECQKRQAPSSSLVPVASSM